MKLGYRLTVECKRSKQVFHKRDHVAPELTHFSDCILNNCEPEPSGATGLADIRIIEALFKSSETRRPIPLEPVPQPAHPGIEQEMRRPPVAKPEVVHAEGASQ